MLPMPGPSGIENIHNWCPLCHQRGNWQVETHFPFPAACGAEFVYFPHCLGTVSFSVPSIHRVNEFADKNELSLPLLFLQGDNEALFLCWKWLPFDSTISLSVKLRIVTSKSFLMQYQRLICSNKCHFFANLRI